MSQVFPNPKLSTNCQVFLELAGYCYNWIPNFCFGQTRIARTDKKAFLSEQCKEREENNRMGKTRDLFKKIRDTKGTFHAKMGSI